MGWALCHKSLESFINCPVYYARATLTRWAHSPDTDTASTDGDKQMVDQGMTFESTVDALLRPESASASGILRCADLYCGDGEATRAASAVGVDVVYAYDPDESVCDAYLDRYGQEPFSGHIKDSVEVAPEFDLLLVRIDGKREMYPVIWHTMRFVRARTLVGVIFWQHGSLSGFDMELASIFTGDPELPSFTMYGQQHDDLSFVVISNVHDLFPWPDVLSLENVIAAFASSATKGDAPGVHI